MAQRKIFLALAFCVLWHAPCAPAWAKKAVGDPQAIFEAALLSEQKQDWLAARNQWHEIIEDHPHFERISEAQEHLTRINMHLLFSASNAPQSVIHVVQKGDTLGKIAKQYATTIDLIKRRNGLNSHLIKAGDKLSIWKAPFEIYVDKSSNILMVKSEKEVLKVYRVSTGAGNTTPVGNFTIINKLVDPVWYHQGVVVPPGVPENFLGTRWMGFDIPKYGIHGTVEPERIGQSVSAGCVRLRNEDVEELFSYIPEGTKVTIAN